MNSNAVSCLKRSFVYFSNNIKIRKKICSLPSSMVAPRTPRGREKITAVVKRLFRRENTRSPENTFNFAGGRGGEVRSSLLFLISLQNFSRLAMVIFRILQPFLCFFFHQDGDLFLFLTSWLFIPLLVFSLLRYSLLVTRYCVTLFSNKHTSLMFLFGRHWGMTEFYTGINKEKACHQQ